MPAHRCLAIIGVGLIGGSIGQAVRQCRLFEQVVGIGRRTEQLQRAYEMGAADRVTKDLEIGVAEANLVVVCAPVEAIADLVCQVAEHCPPGALITDAGSTKGQLVAEIEGWLRQRSGGPRFVGSHPMAGDHRTGVEHARPDMFTGRTVVVTPTEHTRPTDVEEICRFWRDIGGEVLQMSADEHDVAVAATSHLPHLVAYALAAATPEEVGPLAASGWRDTTRVAAADPGLWRQIFDTNREALESALARFDAKLRGMREALAAEDHDQLLTLLEEAKRIRDALGN